MTLEQNCNDDGLEFISHTSCVNIIKCALQLLQVIGE